MSRRTIDREYAEHECDEICQDILARDRAEFRERRQSGNRECCTREGNNSNDYVTNRRNRRDVGTRISGQECDMDSNCRRDCDECHECLTRNCWGCNNCRWNRWGSNRCGCRSRCNRCERERCRDCDWDNRSDCDCDDRSCRNWGRCGCNRSWNQGCGCRRGVNCDRNRRFRDCNCCNEY